MTNYKTILENLIENGETVEKIQEQLENINKAIYTEHCKKIAIAENPFSELYNNDICTIYGFNPKTRILTEKEKRVKSNDIEKSFRLLKSEATNKNGKPMVNNNVTIFGDFKIISALQSFIKKCNNEVTKEIYTFDKKTHNDTTLQLDFSNIMNSETALDKAINNILKLVNISATYKKKYNDLLKHFETKQKINAKGITISDSSIYETMDYIIDCCKDRITVKLSYVKEKKNK